jgi:hypothetical protein
MKKTKIYVAIPSTGTVADGVPFAQRQYERDYGDRIEFVYPDLCVQRKFHDFARNAMVEDFLKTDCDILWFWDSDILPPPNVLDLVTENGEHWELAGAPYPVFMSPQNGEGQQVVMCVYASSPKGMHAMKVPHHGKQMVDGLATGCMFIKREVFSKMQKPYFEFKYDPETRYMVEGEDLGFCMKANDLGYQFFTDFSMVCKHYKTVDLLEVNNYAITYAHKAITAYDDEVRPKVAALALELKKAKAATKPKSSLILPDRKF